MGGIQLFAAQIRQFWFQQTPTRKALFSAATVILLLLVGSVGYWAYHTEYKVLFSELSADDAAAIVKKLEADRTSYQLTAGGTTIQVPAESVHKVRMTLVSSGLPQGSGKGFEIFDQMSMGATPFVQNLNYTRAIQGELARTIMTLEPVAHARIHIVQPEPSVFVREERPVTASVVIKTKVGATLSRRATAGIVALVAGSVKGLTSENVTVIDTDGVVLSEQRNPNQGSASSDQLSYQRDVENHLASKAQEILTRLLGPGRSVVRVSSEMSFRHLTESTEKFDPEGKVLTHESLTSSKSTSPSANRGVTGASSNIPPGQQTISGGNGQNKNDETIENQYAVSKTQRTLKEQQGVIDRLTVAVILIPPTIKGEMPDEDILGITPTEAKELVKQAVGFKEGRDQIQVSVGKDLDAEEATVDEAAAIASQQLIDKVMNTKHMALGIGGLALIGIGVMGIRRLFARPQLSPTPAVVASAETASSTSDPDELAAIASTIKLWLEESSVLPFDRETSKKQTPATSA